MIAANLTLLFVFLAVMLLGAPIAIALGLAGFAAIAVGLDAAALQFFAGVTFSSITKYPLIAIPLFVLTGMIFERSGVAAGLIAFAQSIVGPRRGGLAIVAILVCLIMGGMSGSGPADAAAVATSLIPSMKRAGYPPAFSASVIAAGASAAILIPPSLALIIYSVIVPGIDLRALFAAGIAPGLLLGFALITPAWLISRKHGFGVDEGDVRPPFWQSFRRAIPGLMAPVIILGGLRSGLFTPTEAASAAAAYGVFVGVFVYRTMGLREIYRSLSDAAEISAVVMFIVGLAGVFAWAGTTLGAFDQAAQAILDFTREPMVVLLMMMAILLVAGMLLDGVSVFMITLPLLFPLAVALNWNLTWFGILMAINVAIGTFTPPMAVNLMVTAKIGNIPLESTFSWVLWFVFSAVLILLLLIFFPEIALWLPRALGYVV